MKKEPNILFVCETNNFQNFTRRATVEAVCKINKSSSVICVFKYSERKSANLKSDFVQVKPYYRFFPLKLLQNAIINKINLKLNQLIHPIDFNSFDHVVLSSPLQSFLVDLIGKEKIIAILSDPYHLMKRAVYSYESHLLRNSKIIYATSRALAQHYISKYFPDIPLNDKRIVYWPNCVDLKVWDINKLKETRGNKTGKKPTIGFAGNFMSVTDVKLLHTLVLHFKEHQFMLAGKLFYQEGTEDLLIFNKIMECNNVTYKGYIPYNELQQEVFSWDICIMIDKKDEISSYHHHNKLYQYLALGKPVVYQMNHRDYTSLTSPVYGAETPQEFINHLSTVIQKINEEENFVSVALDLAKANSNDSRAITFMENLNNIR